MPLINITVPLTHTEGSYYTECPHSPIIWVGEQSYCRGVAVPSLPSGEDHSPVPGVEVVFTDLPPGPVHPVEPVVDPVHCQISCTEEEAECVVDQLECMHSSAYCLTKLHSR